MIDPFQFPSTPGVEGVEKGCTGNKWVKQHFKPTYFSEEKHQYQKNNDEFIPKKQRKLLLKKI